MSGRQLFHRWPQWVDTRPIRLGGILFSIARRMGRRGMKAAIFACETREPEPTRTPWSSVRCDPIPRPAADPNLACLLSFANQYPALVAGCVHQRINRRRMKGEFHETVSEIWLLRPASSGDALAAVRLRQGRGRQKHNCFRHHCFTGDGQQRPADRNRQSGLPPLTTERMASPHVCHWLGQI